LEKAPSFSDMLSAKRKPILFSCRRPQDGGNWKGTETERLTLLRQAVMSKADYVEIESDVAGEIRPFPGCQRVISYTNTDKMPADIDDIYQEMLAAKPDVIKLTVRARTPEEAWPLVQILGKAKVPTVVTGLGRPGVMLAILGRKIGAPWTSAALERGSEAFAGQPTISDLVEIYRYRDIAKSTRFFGVTGLGEREFLAAGLMNAAFAHLGTPHRVLPMQIGNLKLFRKVIDAVKIQGVSVEDAFIDHVHEAATYDDSSRPPVQGADVMLPNEEGGWTGSNTLGRWAAAALEEALRLREPEKAEPIRGRIVMMAGAGPLTRMLASQLKERGAALVFASKDRNAAMRLSQTFGGRQIGWEGIYATIHDVLVVGGEQREGDESEEPTIHPGYLKQSMTVMDLTSIPRRSPFLREAKLRGCSIVEPGRLLAEQVREHVRRLCGQETPLDVLQAKLAGWLVEDEGE
jgi:3-dehydroquinate dehydratase/shikimate dehydrogenase